MDTLPSPATAAAAASAAASTVNDLAAALAEQTASSRRTARALANQLLSAETFYENFLELLAQLTSLLLTDEETERIATSLKQFHATLQRVSSRSALAVTGSPLHAAWQPLPGGGTGATPPGTPPGFPNLDDASDFPPVPIPKPLQCAHKGTCTQHCTRGFLRTLLVGYAIKYAVGTLPMLFSPAKLMSRPSLLLREINKDTVQFALFLSTFTTGYKALFCAFRRYFATRHEWWVGRADNVPKRLRKLAAFLAGALASLSILIDKNKGRRTAIALYFLTRAIEFGVKFGFTRWRKGWELRFGPTSESRDVEGEIDEQVKDSGLGDSPPQSTAPAQPESTDDLGSNDSGLHVLTPSQLLRKRATPTIIKSPASPGKTTSRMTQLAHAAARRLPDFLASSAGVLVMSLSSSQILFSYVAMPDTLASSYMSFLLTHGGQRDRMGPLVAHALRTMGRIVWRTTGYPHLADVYCNMPEGAGSNTSTSPWMAPGKFAMCGMIHPDHDLCHRFAAQCFLTSFKRSAKLYAPLNLAMTLVLGHAKLRKRPLASLQRLILSTIRSSLFLAGYVTTAWSATCTFRNALQREHIAFYLVNGMLSGAWSMLEPPGRRLDLGLYCLPRALEAFWRALIVGGVLPTVPSTKEERARMGAVKRVLANVLTTKSVGEPLYFAIATGLLLSLYEGEQWVLSSGYKSVMVRFFGVN
ncbi:hypothetical protein BCR44DRAFT_1438892 [Catenaria anguillulae PL171]|uniref:Transmembrane protein 135 N-terminal domain-containing protein n=1 Tax=Catenaria anguillulae PL171 TaxID=765915 RepID=A0A1Y2HF46_9FUNG|nr:hypothetical protein BCR44DRAFT_1438892 [Catenaria anguillulae PL171]